MVEFTENAALAPEQVTETLEAHGIYPTPQRVEIAQLLLSQPQHLSAEQVLEQVNRGGQVVSKATVYNTLGLFARKGLVREVIVDPTKVFYDSNTSPHHHVYNVDTASLVDVDARQVDVGKLPELPGDTVIDGVDVVIRVRNRG